MPPWNSALKRHAHHEFEKVVLPRGGGWTELTTTRVAEVAGVSVGSLYQYFPNREEIAVEIVRQRTRAILEAVLAIHLAGVTDLDEAARRAMAVFLAKKQRTLDLTLALRDALPKVQGRAGDPG